MPTDYNKIREDNIREYGEGTRHLAFLGRLYTDRTHFIFELLQNAEDAGAKRISFRLFEDRLEVSHNGRPFNEEDVRGVCGVGEGTKTEDLTQIGKFGIGFKSVYAYTATPEIHSGGEGFKIENYVRPSAVTPKPISNSWTTLFVFSFNAENVSQESACKEIGARLSNLNARTLLFLRKINEIEYRLPDSKGGVYLREEITRGTARQVSVIGQNNNEDEEESWLIFERKISVPKKSETVRVEVGFLLEAEVEDNKTSEHIIKIKDSPLVVFFPTEKATRFGFLIQGPYRTTPSRDNIPKDDEWNETLVKETAELIAEILPQIKDLGLLSVSFLEALPIRAEDFSEDSMFYPIYESVRNTLIKNDLLPTDNGSFVSAYNAKLARGVDLRKLLSSDQLNQLFQSSKLIRWLTGDITQDRTPDLRRYLINILDVEEVTPDSFARKISHQFLSDQPDEWFIDFFRYLSSQEALWRAPRLGRDSNGILRSKTILRLEDGDQVIPFREDGSPNAFLPPFEDTTFPVVKRSITNDEQSKEFLKRLGLSEPDIFDDIVERVLPKHKETDGFSISDQEHMADIHKIIRAMNSDSDSGKRKVIQAARRTPFLKGVNLVGEVTYKKPCDLYQENTTLRIYFSGLTDVWFLFEETLSSTVDTSVLSELGIAKKPRFRKMQVDLPEEEKRRLRRNQGHTRDIESIDYDIDGLDSFLSRMPQDNQERIGHSLIIWDFLLAHLKGSSYYPFYEGQYEWFYRIGRIVYFTATWKKRLREFAWIPKSGTEGPFKPSEVSLGYLPEQFERSEKLANLLGMKSDVVSKQAEQLNLKPEVLQYVINNSHEIERLMLEDATHKVRPTFPSRPVANPERRQDRFVEQHSQAPKKEYEKRERSIRTTTGAIDPTAWLKELYTNETEQMICQICKDEMPFKKRDGDYYFEAIEALSNEHFPKEHEAQFLALCPLCAAKYKEFIKCDKDAMADFIKKVTNSNNFEIQISLGEQETSIRFVETHYHDLKCIICKVELEKQ